MNKLCMGILLSMISAFSLARAKDAQRVEVPIYLQKAFAFVDLSIGASGPLSMFIDTGAGGIRVFPGHVRENDIEHTGIENRIGYADGSQGLIGEEVRGSVKIGEFPLPGMTTMQFVQHHFCKSGIDEQCKGAIESKHGGAGTLGLGALTPSDVREKMRKTRVLNPFLTQGPISYILSVPRDERSSGVLIINPTEAEKTRFVKIRHEGKQVPVCINDLCFSALLDTGAGGSNIPVANRRQMRRLGLPVSEDQISAGTTVPVTLGQGKQTITINLVASDRGPSRIRIKDSDGDNATLGINIFHYVDVLYDFDAGIVGFAPKR